MIISHIHTKSSFLLTCFHNLPYAFIDKCDKKVVTNFKIFNVMMQLTKIYSPSLLLGLSLLMFTSCSTDGLVEETIEEDQTTTTLAAKCSNSKNADAPSSNSSFKNAVVQGALESKFLCNTQKNLWNFGNSKSFFLYKGYMVMLGGDDRFDRTEIKQKNSFSSDKWNIMKFKAQVQYLPGGSGVTIAQMHNRHSDVKRPLAKLVLTQGKVRLMLNETYQGTASVYKKNYVNFKDGEFLTIVMENRTNRNLRIYVKNESTGQSYSQLLKIKPIWNSVKNHYYFKTGLYNQGSGMSPRISYKYLTWNN